MSGAPYFAPRSGACTAAFGSAYLRPGPQAVSATFDSDLLNWRVVRQGGVGDLAQLGAHEVRLNFQLVSVEAIYYDGIKPGAPPASRVSAQFTAYAALPATRITSEAVILGAPSVDRFYAPSTQYAATLGESALEVGAPWASFTVRGVSPSGAAPQPLGSPSVRNVSSGLFPSGIYSLVALGAPQVENTIRILAPVGAHASLYGTPVVFNLKQIVGQTGNIGSKLAYGKPTIYNRDKYLTGKGWLSQSVGAVLVQHGVQRAEPSPIAARSTPSTKAWVSRSPRELAPTQIAPPLLSIPLVGGLQFIEALGFDDTRWGTRIIPESQTIGPEGFVNPFGTPLAWLFHTFAKPGPVDTLHWGTAYVWNSVQFVRVLVDHAGDLAGEKWSIWTKAENRNRTIKHHSTTPSALPSPTVENGARPLLPSGVPAPTWPEHYKAGMVAFGVRPLPLEGIEPPHFARWHAIHNGAFQLLPQGFDASAVADLSRIANNRRYFPWITGGDFALYGNAFVADRVREITFEARYSIGSPSMPIQGIKLHTRYVEPPGQDASRIGLTDLVIRWNRFTPRWTHVEKFGDAMVRNRTPELHLRGHNTEELGTPAIRLHWREVVTAETFTQALGRPIIAYRTRKIQISGANSLRMGLLKAIRIGEDPPYARTVVPKGVDARFELGKPSMNYRFMYVSGWNAMTFGNDPEVILMGIMPVGIVPRSSWQDFGLPFLVEPTLQGIYDAGRIRPTDEYGTPYMTPQTIWVMGNPPPPAPPRASFRPVNEGVEFGRPRMSQSPQYIRPSGPHMFRMDWPALTLRLKYLPVSGFNSNLSGFHTLIGGDLFIDVDGVQPPATGKPSVKRPPAPPAAQTIKGKGFAGDMGSAAIEHFHRTLNIPGYFAQQMGSSRGGTRYYPQSLHVGFPAPVKIGGIDGLGFGAQWVSYRVRDLFVPGFDQFEEGYEPMKFEARMRVRKAQPDPLPGPPTAQGVLIAGADLLAVGAIHDIRPGQHFIRPDGNAEQFRKGAF